MMRLVVGTIDCGVCEVSSTWRTRRKGLLHRDGIAGSMLLTPCRSVHTIGMRFDLDIAFLRRNGLDGSFTVLRTYQRRKNRFGVTVLRSSAVLEAESGSFAAWGLLAGSVVTIA